MLFEVHLPMFDVPNPNINVSNHAIIYRLRNFGTNSGIF